MKKKIICYCGDMNPKKNSSWGIYNVTINLLKGIEKNSNFELILFITKNNEELFKKIKCKKRYLKEYKSGLLNRLYIDQINCLKKIKKEKPDIIFFPRGVIPFYKSKKIKYVSFIHDFIPHYYLEKGEKKFLPISILLNNSARKSDLIFTNSEFTKSKIKEKTNKKTIVIPLGFDKTKPKKPLIKKPFIYIIGNDKPHKNLEKSIKLFKEYNKKNKNKYDFKLSKGGLSQEEVAGLYKYAKCSLFLSEIEGFGLPLVESYHYETPVVFNNQASLKELGKTLRGKGSCFIEDKSTVFRAIDNVLKMSKKEIKENKKKLEKKYNWENALKKFIKSLEDF